jgi:hypothetical protein
MIYAEKIERNSPKTFQDVYWVVQEITSLSPKILFIAYDVWEKSEKARGD